MSVMVSFCCNDERGNVNGRVTAIHLPNGMLDLETRHVDGVAFREMRPHRIRISRRTFDVHGYRPMYGNVFWNGYELTARDTLRLLAWARETGKWTCEGGWTVIADWWEAGASFEQWRSNAKVLRPRDGDWISRQRWHYGAVTQEHCANELEAALWRQGNAR